MPSHAPNHLVVSIVNPVQHAFFACTFSKPKDYFTVVRSACKELFFVRMPGHYSHLLAMHLEAIYLTVQLTYVKDLDLGVAAACQKPVAIDRVPAHLIDRGVVCVNLVDSTSTCSWVPYLYVLIFTSSQDQRLEGVPIARLYVRSMFGKPELFSGRRKIPNLRPGIIST